MTAILIGPCWTLSHEIHWESWRHFDSELDALIALARDIDREIDTARHDAVAAGEPRPTTAELFADPWEADLAVLVQSKAERETVQCCRIKCDLCGVEAEWDDPDGTTSGEGSHFQIDQLDVLRDGGWQSSGSWDSCPTCPVPEQVARAHNEEQARKPGPNDVPLFEVAPGGEG